MPSYSVKLHKLHMDLWLERLTRQKVNRHSWASVLLLLPSAQWLQGSLKNPPHTIL